MKTVGFYGPKGFRVEEHPVPVPTEGRLLIKVLSCGVCGGEYTTYHNRASYPVPPEGIILGHEMIGRIEDGETPLLKRGDLVAASPNRGCGHCEMCRLDLPFECANSPRRTAATGGGYAQYSLVFPDQCYKLSPDTDVLGMALAEPLACCLHAMNRANAGFGDRVVILGAGAGALLFAQLAKLMGARWVAVADSIPERLELARELGADYTIDTNSADTAAEVKALGGADIVIVTRAKPEFLEQAVSLCDFFGRVLCYGVAPAGISASVAPNLLWKKQLSLIGTRSFSGTFEQAVQLIGDGKITVKRLITRVIGLDGIAAAMSDSGGHIKTVIADSEES